MKRKSLMEKETSMISLLLLLLSMMLIAFSRQAWAIDASGGNLSVQLNIGQASAQAMQNNSFHIISGIGPASYYSSGNIMGHFGLAIIYENDVTPPSIYLQTPLNHETKTYQDLSFVFNADDSSGLENCTLYIDGVAQNTTILPSVGVNSLGSRISGGDHTWRIGCYDTNGNYELSQNRHLKIILASDFDGSTTDLSSTNISSVPNLTIEKSSKGKIKFNTNTNLENVSDLDSFISISDLTISINSANLPMLNKSATLTIYNVPYNNAVILHDGNICDTCTVASYSEGVLVFDVNGFSTYIITSTSQLEIFDDTDSATKEIFEDVGFYANYSNRTSGEPINADCYISFNIGGWTVPSLMQYNSSSTLYYYFSSFNISNTYDFNVSCTPLTSGFDQLSAIDYVIISDLSVGSLAGFNITTGMFGRYDDSRAGADTDAQSGNVSEIPIYIEISSDSWQGYYGNITGKISLADALGNTVYNWNNTASTGEILATRSASIDWNSVSCMTPPVISDEDLYIEKIDSDPQSVNSTFNLTNHPAFMVGTSMMMNCKSTRTFRQTTQQGFWNVLLSDSSGTSLYAGIINPDNYNFMNSTSDFELLVPVKHGIVQQYYFYLELN